MITEEKNVEQEGREVTRKLFGNTVKVHVTGKHMPTSGELKELAQPPQPKHGVANTYCVGCGMIVRINAAGVRGLSQKARISLPVDWRGKYIQVQRCIVCSTEFKDPELKLL